MDSNTDVGALLRFDSLAVAETLTGNSYKEDDATTWLGLGLQMANADAKDSALAATDDTRWNLDLAGTLAIWGRLGFEIVHAREFVSRDDDVETNFILWHPDGILGTVGSYTSTQVNVQNIYYNVRPVGSRHLPWDVTSSGHYYTKDSEVVWVGDHDGREGLRYKLDQLRKHGEFLPVWAERPFLWFLTYEESRDKDHDFKAINESIISELPEHVRAAITPEGAR